MQYTPVKQDCQGTENIGHILAISLTYLGSYFMIVICLNIDLLFIISIFLVFCYQSAFGLKSPVCKQNSFFYASIYLSLQAFVLMTDGQQSWSRDQIPLSDAVKPFINDGTLRYAVGIGSEISPVELNVIAGSNVVLADDFESLLGKLEEQIGLIGTDGCKGIKC